MRENAVVPLWTTNSPTDGQQSWASVIVELFYHGEVRDSENTESELKNMSYWILQRIISPQKETKHEDSANS